MTLCTAVQDTDAHTEENEQRDCRMLENDDGLLMTIL